MFEQEAWESDAHTDALNDSLFGGGKLCNLTRLEKKLKKKGLLTSSRDASMSLNGTQTKKEKLKTKLKLKKNQLLSRNEGADKIKTEAGNTIKEKISKNKNGSVSAKTSINSVSVEEQSCKASKKSKKNKYKHLAGLSKVQKLDISDGEAHHDILTVSKEHSLNIPTPVESKTETFQHSTKKRKGPKQDSKSISNKRKTIQTGSNLTQIEDERVGETSKNKSSKNKTVQDRIKKRKGLEEEPGTGSKKRKTKTETNLVQLEDKAEKNSSNKIKKSTDWKVSDSSVNPATEHLVKNISQTSVIQRSLESVNQTSKAIKKQTLNGSDGSSPNIAVRKTQFSLNKLKGILEDSKSQHSARTDDSTKDIKVPSQENSQKTPIKALSLRDKMKERLSSARFRYINEQLYTSTGADAKQLFEDDQEAFQVYHDGYQSQVVKWPVNPVDKMIEFIKERPKSEIVADFGCGDAQIAQSVKNKVHSFDLVAANEHVTACDMAHIPLNASSVDIGVFCLSLMGTNLTEFVCEANRVIKMGGKLLIAEVISRFEKVGSFVRKMEKLGFKLENKNSTNKMFIWFEFQKSGTPDKSRLPELELAPCMYKRR